MAVMGEKHNDHILVTDRQEIAELAIIRQAFREYLSCEPDIDVKPAKTNTQKELDSYSAKPNRSGGAAAVPPRYERQRSTSFKA